MRNLDLDWEDQYDYGPNEMVALSKSNPAEYNKINCELRLVITL